MSDYGVIDDFCEKCLEWSDRSGESTSVVTGPLMVWTGGHTRYTAIGSNEEGIGGKFSVGQMGDWLRQIVHLTGMFDLLIVYSAIRLTESTLLHAVESYGGEKEHYRHMQAEFRSMIVDKGLISEQAEQVEAAARSLEPQTKGSLGELKQRRDSLLLWQEIMNPIIEKSRLRNV